MTNAAGERMAVSDLFAENLHVVFVELFKLIQDPNTSATAKVAAIKEYNDRAMGKSSGNMVKVVEGADDYDLSDIGDDVLKALANIGKSKAGE